jgi:pyrroloquinoline quinone biosynthesis protein D
MSDRIYRHAPGVETSVLSGEKILLDPQGRMLRGLNPTGARVWELVDGKRSETQIAQVLAEEAGIDATRALADVRAFLSALLEKKLIL